MAKKTLALPRAEDARELAEHISAILRHPHTPAILAEYLLQGIAAVDCSSKVHENPNYVEAILLTHFETEGGAN